MMTNDQTQILLRRYRANWDLSPEVEEEMTAICRTIHEETGNLALDELAADRRKRNKLSKWDGPRANEFYAVVQKHLPSERSTSPPCCDECSKCGWRVVILCGPNWQAFPCSLVYPAQLRSEDPLSKWYWQHRVPCRCRGGEHRREKYTQFTAEQADRLYAASMTLASGNWLCEDLQNYSDHFHNRAPLFKKGEPDPDIVKMVERAVAAMQSGSTGKSDERMNNQPTPIEQSWENAEESWR